MNLELEGRALAPGTDHLVRPLKTHLLAWLWLCPHSPTLLPVL